MTRTAEQNRTMERYGAGAIVVADYDPAWPAMFEQERARLSAALGPLVVAIEHVGSTAVPGLPAKPIIDLLVGVRSLDAAPRCIEQLTAIGYTFMPEYRAFLPDQLFFRKGVPGPWTYHVHLMQPLGPGWERRLVFRDYLRARPDVAAAYTQLKRSLAARFKDDIAAYRSGKDAFVADVMARAMANAREQAPAARAG
jgi:GrpB-like predicted nucleotidyltransferase (UPF0157 family)